MPSKYTPEIRAKAVRLVRPPDLVDRQFRVPAPNMLVVADFKCRRRHLKSYADPRNMPTTAVLVQANGGNEVQKVGIDA